MSRTFYHMSLTLATTHGETCCLAWPRIRQHPTRAETAWPLHHAYYYYYYPHHQVFTYISSQSIQNYNKEENLLQHHHSKILLKWNTVEYTSGKVDHCLIWLIKTFEKKRLSTKNKKSRHCFLHIYTTFIIWWDPSSLRFCFMHPTEVDTKSITFFLFPSNSLSFSRLEEGTMKR